MPDLDDSVDFAWRRLTTEIQDGGDETGNGVRHLELRLLAMSAM